MPLRLALIGLLVAATAAGAAQITEAPTISGVPAVGQRLDATTGSWTPAGADPDYAWLRCTGEDCTPIDGACSRSHLVAAEDAGHSLRVRLTVTDGAGTASASSASTAVVPEPTYTIPGDGQPDPDTCTKVTRTSPSTGSFESGTQAEPVTPVAGPTPFISPFPKVRIAGRFSTRYTRITRVSVRAPRGVRIGVQCKGKRRGCATRRRALAVRLVKFRVLQRRYRPGAILELRVTQAKHIGKYVHLRIRVGKAPTRIDRCLYPRQKRPVRCPAA